MGVSKVEFAGNTLIDLTEDTVQPTSLVAGYTATNSAGEKIEGEFIPIYLDGEGNIKSMYEDANKTKEFFPKTKTEAISDEDGIPLDLKLEQLGKDVNKQSFAYNLLDNSDFRNPVNQRGKTSYTGDWTYSIDRWIVSSTGSGMSLSSGYVELKPNSKLLQAVPIKHSSVSGKTYSLAVGLVGWSIDALVVSGAIKSVTQSVVEHFSTTKDGLFIRLYSVNNSDWLYVDIHNQSSSSITAIKWVALYEGSYTAETLPPYHPKGYGVELAECLRYFERIGHGFSGNLGNVVFAPSGATGVMFTLNYYQKRTNPSVNFSSASEYRVLLRNATTGAVATATGLKSVDEISANTSSAIFRANINAISQNYLVQLQRQDSATSAWIDILADL